VVISRGEVHFGRLDATLGSELQKTRPCVVVSPDELNAHLRTVILSGSTIHMGATRGLSGWTFAGPLSYFVMNVSVELEPDVALVLFELLASRDDLPEQLRLEAPERHALWALEAALEKRLVAPLAPDYRSQLLAARRSIVERLGA
jgi:hypothetical protein